METFEVKRHITLYGSNYVAWKFQNTVLLKSSGVYYVIEKPKEENGTPEAKKKFEEDDIKHKR